MTESEYYKAMSSFDSKMPPEEVAALWRRCFAYILRSYKLGFTEKAIERLFEDFEMCNWPALHRDKCLETKDMSTMELRGWFASECHYISDRASFDRLFRTHWLYNIAYRWEVEHES